MTETYSHLLIRIRPKDNATGAYPVEAVLDDAVEFMGELRLDLDRLAATRLDPAEYGLALFDALFAGPMRRAYDRAFGQAAVETGGRMRVQLRIDAAASELHGLVWEGMYHIRQGQEVPLVVSTLTPFSRYIGQALPAPPPIPPPEKGRPIRMLFAVSNPSDLDEFGLSSLDLGREVMRLQSSIGGLQQSGLLTIRVLVGRSGLSSPLRQELEEKGYELVDGPITLSSLARQMSNCHVVHLMCHGATSRTEEAAALILEDADGRHQFTQDQQLIQALVLAGQLPRLLFLMSGDSPRGHAVNPHVRLGTELVNAGIPAVIVMQDVITIEGASLATSVFYDNLLRYGCVDRALNEARLGLYNHSRAAPRDWLVPVLFTRLRTGQIISVEEKAKPPLPTLQELPQVGVGAKEPIRPTIAGDEMVRELTQRLSHLATNLRHLHTLVDLANQLQQMREGFIPCARIVQQAGPDVVKIQVDPLSWVWQPLRDGSLKRLQLFLQQHAQLPVEGWFPQLMEQAGIIESSLRETALGALARGVTTFDRQLTEAEPYVRQQLDQAIAELVSYSDQTLGRFDLESDSRHD